MADWAAAGPNSATSRTPGHGSGGSGAAKRRAPIGGRAKGMPRKTASGPSVVPRSFPEVTSTVGATARGPYRGGRSGPGRDTALLVPWGRIRNGEGCVSPTHHQLHRHVAAPT